MYYNYYDAEPITLKEAAEITGLTYSAIFMRAQRNKIRPIGKRKLLNVKKPLLLFPKAPLLKSPKYKRRRATKQTRRVDVDPNTIIPFDLLIREDYHLVLWESEEERRAFFDKHNTNKGIYYIKRRNQEGYLRNLIDKEKREEEKACLPLSLPIETNLNGS